MSFSIKAIDHIQLAAPKNSEQTARDFYHAILGFKEVEKPRALQKNGGVWFSYGNCQLHIGIEDPFIPAKKAHPAFEVENLNGLQKRLAENGISVISDKKLPGAKRFYVSDPFGNRIEFLEWIEN